MIFETAFAMDTSSIKFGPGVTHEIGHDMKRWGTTRVMVVTPHPARRDDLRQLFLASIMLW